jgi:HEAT repeat protein
MSRPAFRYLIFAFLVQFLTILACDGGFVTSSPDPTITMPSTIEGLAMALSDPDYAVRSRAAKAIGEMGPDAAPAIPALAQALSDPSPEMRLFTAEAFSKIGPAAEPALPEIMKALSSDERDQEGPFLVITVGNIGSAAEPAVPLLIDILKYENDDFTRSLAAESLGKIGDPRALTALMEELDSKGGDIFDVRESAIRAVARFDGRARSAIPTLVKLLDDENSYVSEQSACAIAKITGESFPDSEGECKFVSTGNGEARIVVAARKWWEQDGQFQSWDN